MTCFITEFGNEACLIKNQIREQRENRNKHRDLIMSVYRRTHPQTRILENISNIKTIIRADCLLFTSVHKPPPIRLFFIPRLEEVIVARPRGNSRFMNLLKITKFASSWAGLFSLNFRNGVLQNIHRILGLVFLLHANLGTTYGYGDFLKCSPPVQHSRVVWIFESKI